MPEHPAEEMLERFALRRLPAHLLMEILHHLDSCAPCREQVEAERVFAETIRQVLLARGGL